MTPKRNPGYGFLYLSTTVFLFLMISVPEPTDGKRICGRELVTTLSMLCETYPTLSATVYNKRTKVNDVDFGDFDATMFKTWPFKTNYERVVDEVKNYKSNEMFPENYPKKNFFMLKGTADGGEVPETKEAHLRMVKRGIVEECCHNACSFEQMRAYCLS
uniref:(northern house mosquito) hypothetical protein n=1 Tax=Culex pipiens TaxID=7175 RepID=A0A8D8AU24_CULPI